jgi:TolB-like protein/Tfp pilus assembly protein PilF
MGVGSGASTIRAATLGIVGRTMTPAQSQTASLFAEPSAGATREQIQKIASSEMFENSTRMQRFLCFVAECVLTGRGKDLKEYLIGVEVFDRPASFDPRQDPIVRVEARRLRSKLDDYYNGPGRADELLVEFSKGTYAPRFVWRHAAPEPESNPKSIAVLPFRNLGPEPDHAYFSEGLSEELIHLLTTVPGLRVMAWHSSARLKSSQYDLARIRQQLRVDILLSGTVRRVGDQLRITAQLIDTADGRYLWSELYERRMQDLFAIEEDIASAIVNTLKIRLGSRPVSPATRQKGSNLDSHNLYLLGRYHTNRRTAEGLTKSIDCFEKALSLDPDNARAHGALAETYSLAADYGVRTPSECVSLAKAAARRALELDPMLAEPYTSLAFLRSNYDWEWHEAERLFRRAIEINPGHATAHQWFGVDYLANLGRWDEAFEELEIAMRLDPLSAIILQGKGYMFLLVRQYEKALQCYQELLDFDPYFAKGLSAVGRVLTQTGKYAEAIEMYKKARALAGQVPDILGALGQTYALAGMEDYARQTLEELSELSKHRFTPATCFALIHVGLGETETALQFLEMGAERHDLPLSALKVHPVYDPIRSEPRFQALLRRVGLE